MANYKIIAQFSVPPLKNNQEAEDTVSRCLQPPKEEDETEEEEDDEEMKEEEDAADVALYAAAQDADRYVRKDRPGEYLNVLNLAGPEKKKESLTPRLRSEVKAGFLASLAMIDARSATKKHVPLVKEPPPTVVRFPNKPPFKAPPPAAQSSETVGASSYSSKDVVSNDDPDLGHDWEFSDDEHGEY